MGKINKGNLTFIPINVDNTSKYRQLFSEIIVGFSSVNHSSFGELNIKHLSYLDIGEMDGYYGKFLFQAESQGIPNYQSRIKQIISDKLWTQKEEDYINDNEKMISNLKINLSKDYLKSRRSMMRGQIADIQKDINKYKIKRDYLIGHTAESYANKKLTYHKIIHSYYKTKTEKLIKDYEEEIKDEDYHELIEIYNKFQDKFNPDNMRMLAISPFFTSIFYLSADDAFNFYGKPIVDLTSYQVDLFSYAKYYKHIISQFGNSIPNEIRSNPEELMEWIEIRDAATEAKVIGNDDENAGGGSSILGATIDDYRTLGIQVQKNNPISEALKKNKGQTLNKEQILKLTD